MFFVNPVVVLERDGQPDEREREGEGGLSRSDYRRAKNLTRKMLYLKNCELL